MSNEFDSVFGGVENAKAIGGFASRLGIGMHRLALKRYQVKKSSKGMGNILEADFVVLDSKGANPHEVGETRGWAWFINASGWAGAYEEARAKDFIQTVAACIDDTRPVRAIGGDLAGPAQAGRGLVIEVEISPQTGKDGAPKKNAKGETYTNATWKPVKQSLADIGAGRRTLDEMDAGEKPAPAPSQGGGSGMGGYTGGLGSGQASQAGEPASGNLTGGLAGFRRS